MDLLFPLDASFEPQTVVKLDGIPEPEIVQSLIDTYFHYCHCQPYIFFQESSFRRRLGADAIPSWLLLAVLASASIFSSHPFLQGRQADAAEYYASCSWGEMHTRMFEEEDFVTIQVVQATSMLAVIDFTGKPKQAFHADNGSWR